jgi:hypothetical protein
MTSVSAIPLLQAAVTPCIIISGVGLLVLSMANRFGRPIDRVRALLPEIARCTNEEEKDHIREEIKVRHKALRALVNA